MAGSSSERKRPRKKEGGVGSTPSKARKTNGSDADDDADAQALANAPATSAPAGAPALLTAAPSTTPSRGGGAADSNETEASSCRRGSAWGGTAASSSTSIPVVAAGGEAAAGRLSGAAAFRASAAADMSVCGAAVTVLPGSSTTSANTNIAATSINLYKKGYLARKPIDKPEKQPSENTKAKDAIIYVPGIDHSRTAYDLASRLAAALDIISPIKNKDFKAEIAKPTILPYGSNQQEFQSQVSEIFMEEYPNDADTRTPIRWPIADFYCFDYHENMTQEWSDAQLYNKLWLMFLTIAIYTCLTFKIALTKMASFGRKANGVGTLDIAQFVVLTFFLFVIVLYFVFLLLAAIEAVLKLAGIENTFMGYAQQIFTLASFLGFASSTEFKKAMVNVATDYTTCLQYLMFGSQKQELHGQLTRLVEETRRLGQYDRIHIVAYSFGSIIAIDALYPLDGKRENQFDNLHHFVTVGCPFDMVRTYLPRYYSKLRCSGKDRKFCWTNIFVPADIFASNFSNTHKQQEARGQPVVTVFGPDPVQNDNGKPIQNDIGRPDQNVPYYISPNDDLQFLSCLFAAGLTSHGHYWDDVPSGADVSKEIARSIFDNHWVVRTVNVDVEMSEYKSEE